MGRLATVRGRAARRCGANAAAPRLGAVEFFFVFGSRSRLHRLIYPIKKSRQPLFSKILTRNASRDCKPFVFNGLQSRKFFLMLCILYIIYTRVLNALQVIHKQQLTTITAAILTPLILFKLLFYNGLHNSSFHRPRKRSVSGRLRKLRRLYRLRNLNHLYCLH